MITRSVEVLTNAQRWESRQARYRALRVTEGGRAPATVSRNSSTQGPVPQSAPSARREASHG